ncbi:MAG TPA: hypothetical protein VGC78_13825 [Gaiellaceae bacterium]
MSAQALLAAAAARVETGWSQGADARDVTGCPTEPWSPEAQSWSLLGALVASLRESEATNGEGYAIRGLAAACSLLAGRLDVASLEEWNDDPARTQSEVTGVLSAAGA